MSREATDLYRQLARELPRVHRPDLANALNNLSVRLSALDQVTDALAAAQESVEMRRALAVSEPQVFAAELADSLINLGRDLLAAGRASRIWIGHRPPWT